MANHPSSLKRQRQSEKRRVHNRGIKSEMKTLAKKILSAGKDEAIKLAKTLQSKLDKAGRRGILHKKSASRKVAQLLSSLKSKVS